MRDSTILVALSLASILVGGYLVFYGRAASEANATAASGASAMVMSVPFIKIADGAHAKITRRVNYVLDSQAQLDSLWKSVGGASSTAPAVDFGANEVLALFAGAEPTAGYAVSVSGIESRADIETVHISFTQPGVSCSSAQAVTHPFVLVAIPKMGANQLTHTYSTTTVQCQ